LNIIFLPFYSVFRPFFTKKRKYIFKNAKVFPLNLFQKSKNAKVFVRNFSNNFSFLRKKGRKTVKKTYSNKIYMILGEKLSYIDDLEFSKA